MRKKAFSGIGFIVFVFIFAIIATLSIEYYRIFTIKESVSTEISRALNISVDTAMQDVDWIQHNSVMNTSIAEAEFKKYLEDSMELNQYYERYDSNGDFMYQIIIDSQQIEESPARYSIKGKIRLQPAMIRKFFADGYKFDIAFSQTSRNTRYDD